MVYSIGMQIRPKIKVYSIGPKTIVYSIRRKLGQNHSLRMEIRPKTIVYSIRMKLGENQSGYYYHEN